MDLMAGGVIFVNPCSPQQFLPPGQILVALAGSLESLEEVRSQFGTLSEAGAAVLLLVVPAGEGWHPEVLCSAGETPVFVVSVAHHSLFNLVGDLLRLFPGPPAAAPSSLNPEAWQGRPKASLQHIATELAVRTSTTVTIKTSDFEVLAFSTSRDAADSAILPGVVSREAVATMRRSGLLTQLDRTQVPLRMPPVESAGLSSRVVMPIRGAGHEVLGYIRMVDGRPDTEVEVLFREDIQRAARRAAIPVMHQMAMKTARESTIWWLLDSLFAGSLDFTPWARSQFSELGLELLPFCFVMVFSVELACDSDDSDQDYLTSKAVELCQENLRVYRTLCPALARCCRHGYGLARMAGMVEAVIMWEDFLDQRDIRELAGALHTEMVSNIGTSQVRLSAGVGALTQGLGTLFRSYQEAVGALDIGKVLWGPGRLTFSDDLGIMKSFAAGRGVPEPGDSFTRFWGLLEEYDARHGTELARTVACFLDCLGSVRRSAKHLYVHPNTVLYRLRKAEQLTAMALDDPNLRTLVHLELKLRQIMGPIRSRLHGNLEADTAKSPR